LNPIEFGKCTLGEVLTFIHAKNKQNEFQNSFLERLMQIHATNDTNNAFYLANSRKRIKVSDLFKSEDDIDNVPKRAHNDAKAKEIFEKMQKVILKKHGNNR
jgi:hypothetical protein